MILICCTFIMCYKNFTSTSGVCYKKKITYISAGYFCNLSWIFCIVTYLVRLFINFKNNRIFLTKSNVNNLFINNIIIMKYKVIID